VEKNFTATTFEHKKKTCYSTLHETDISAEEAKTRTSAWIFEALKLHERPKSPAPPPP